MELLEIEKELASANRVAAMERYDRVFVALDDRRREAVREGLPPADFRRCVALGEAVVLARKLLRLQVKGTA